MPKLERSLMAGGTAGSPRRCDSCRSEPWAVYCHADVAYLCIACDGRVHAANCVASRHERVWICDACENAPAEITCKADAAALCAACDAEVHSANPLARRHHRLPILPLSSEEVVMGRRARGGPVQNHQVEDEAHDDDDGGETIGWMVANPPVVKNPNNQTNNGFLLSEEIDEYLDLRDYNSCGEIQIHDQIYNPNLEVRDRIVPARYAGEKDLNPQLQQQQEDFQFELGYLAPKSEFCYTTDSISHCVSLSSLDNSIVPDSTTTTTAIVSSHGRPSKGTTDLFSGPPYPIQSQFSPMDREARVLRYREKRKMRKFEKTIRYASRKAYAETRPRIKGRFAKRSEVEVEVDQMFSAAISSEGSYSYSVVPSF